MDLRVELLIVNLVITRHVLKVFWSCNLALERILHRRNDLLNIDFLRYLRAPLHELEAAVALEKIDIIHQSCLSIISILYLLVHHLVDLFVFYWLKSLLAHKLILQFCGWFLVQVQLCNLEDVFVV